LGLAARFKFKAVTLGPFKFAITPQPKRIVFALMRLSLRIFLAAAKF